MIQSKSISKLQKIVEPYFKLPDRIDQIVEFNFKEQFFVEKNQNKSENKEMLEYLNLAVNEYVEKNQKQIIQKAKEILLDDLKKLTTLLPEKNI